jgi:hypothetical protein
METPPSSPPESTGAPGTNGVEPAGPQMPDLAFGESAAQRFDFGFDFDMGEMDMDAFLQDLQQSVPDVGRLFDGSLGAF